MAREVTLLRHATPLVRPGMPPQYWPLSLEGRAAARRLSVRADPGTQLASSPELKALETLCLACGVDREAVHVDARFGEVIRVEPFDQDYRDRRRAWISGQLDDRHRNWESPSSAAQRFQTGLDDIDGHAFVATHGMIMTAWLVASGAVDQDQAGSYWDQLRFPELIRVDPTRPMP